jgi:hypothetical protein
MWSSCVLGENLSTVEHQMRSRNDFRLNNIRLKRVNVSSFETSENWWMSSSTKIKPANRVNQKLLESNFVYNLFHNQISTTRWTMLAEKRNPQNKPHSLGWPNLPPKSDIEPLSSSTQHTIIIMYKKVAATVSSLLSDTIKWEQKTRWTTT